MAVTNRYHNHLIDLIETDDRVLRLLKAVHSLGLDQWCIAAGTIRNLVWDHLHDFEEPTLPSDIDVLFYDETRIHADYEKSLEAKLHLIEPDVQWEVVNQATIHTYTGDPKPYTSIVDAMSRWADLVTAIGAFIDDNEQIQLIAPAGLNDLFQMQVRPNIATPTSAAVYQQRMKNKGWQERWPKLSIHGLEPES